MPLSVSRPILTRDDFINFTLFQLISKYWRLVEDYDEDECGIYYFWIPSFGYVLARIKELHLQYDPTMCSDSEKFFENLVRYNKLVKRRERIKFKRYLKETSNER